MESDPKSVIASADEGMKQSLQRFEDQLLKIRAGRATPAMLDGITLEYYGAQTPLNQLANISAPDAKTLTIQPFDKGSVAAIEKALMEANLGMTPQNDGALIRLNVPPMTEERRKLLVKQTKEELEKARVSIRNQRKEHNDLVKQLVKDGLSEDEGRAAETEIQKLTDQYTEKVETAFGNKEKELLTV